jgi:hypothetical protein
MTKQRFEELEKRNVNNPMQLAYELYSEECRPTISPQDFQSFFPMWLGTFGGKSIQQAIEYFKNNKLT